MKKLTIIDGYSFLFRAYYATLKNELYTKNGIPINAIYTFAKMINKIINILGEDDCIFVGFDSIKPSFRKSQFAGYKANRQPCPENLKIQMPITHEFLEAMSIFNYEIDGFEGDDICGSIAKIASKNNYDITIYTSDHDFFQLIDDNIKIKLIKNGINNAQEINKKNLHVLYGLNAEQLIDFKGLIGDKSDNLPGIPGIGPKNAQFLLNKYHSFEEIIIQAKNNNQEIKSKLIENLIKYQKQGEISKSLAIIKTDLSFPFSIKKLKYRGYSVEKIKKFCKKYELENLLINLPKNIKENNNSNLVKIDDLPDKAYKIISLFLDIRNDKINNIIVSDNKKTYIVNQTNFEKSSNLSRILADKNIKKYVYDYKESKTKLNEIGFDLFGLDFCLLSAINLINNSLKKDFVSIINYFDNDLKTNISIFEYPSYLFKLKKKIIFELKKNKIYNLFTKIEMPSQEIILNKKSVLLTNEEIKKLTEIKEKNKNTTLYFIIEHLIRNNKQFYKDFNLKVESTILENSKLLNTETNLIKKTFNLNNFCLILFNYSQIELQILALLSKTKKIIEMFEKKYDVYKEIARKIFKKKTNIKEKKNIEKIIKFGIISGNKLKAIEETNLNKEKITELIKKFYIAYPEIKLYFKNLIFNINEKKSVKNFFNRTCYYNRKDKFNLIKKIVNFPIEETINDVIKTSIVKIENFFEREKFESELFLQINNNLIIKIKKNEKNELINKIKNIMKDILPIELEISTKEII